MAETPKPKGQDPVSRHLAAGKHLLIVGSHNAAAEQLRAALALDPNNGNAHIHLARAMIQAKKLDEAEHEAEIALGIEAENAYYRYIKGIVHKQQRQWKRAEEMLKSAVAVQPAWSAPYEELAWIFNEQGRYADAESYARRAIELRPESSFAHLQLGHVLLSTGRTQESLALLETGLRLAPENSIAHDAMARYHLINNQLQAAEMSLRQALLLFPYNAAAHCRLARVLLRQDKNEEAMREVDLALEIYPHRVYSLYMKGCVLTALEQYEAALDWLERAVQSGVRSLDFYLELSRAYNHLKRCEDAEVTARHALEINNESASAWVQLGYALQPQGRIEESRKAFETALKFKPQLSIIQDGMGWFYLRCGQVEQALPFLRKAVEISPGNSYAQRNLKRALALLENDNSTNLA